MSRIRVRLRFPALLLAGLTLIHPALAANGSAPQPYRTGELLVKFRADTAAATRAATRADGNVVSTRRLGDLGIEHWRLREGVSVAETAAELSARGDVVFAEPNYLRFPLARPNDPELERVWALENSGQTLETDDGDVSGTAGADIDAPAAWDLTTGSLDVVVAVLDTGMDTDHEDLVANLWSNKGEIDGNGVDDDGNGYVDDLHGWDFADDDNDPNHGDDSDHGTMVAGTLGAAGNNATGIAGVNWRVSIMPLRFGLDVAGELEAFQYAIDNGAHIVNASFGGPTFSEAERQGIDALAAAGILLVAAAGNAEADNDSPQTMSYPADHTAPNVLSVAATTPRDTLTDWSQYGTTSVDIAAPGEDVYTTRDGGGYGWVDGTSFASPYTAGVAALVKALHPEADYRGLKARVLAGAEPRETLAGHVATGARLDALGALTVTPRPVLVIADIALDDSAGNGDGWADPGETVDLTITVENLWAEAAGVGAGLATTAAGVTVDSPEAVIGNIGPRGTAANTVPLRVSLAPSVTGPARLPFTLTLTTADGRRVTRRFSLEVLGRVTPGETVSGLLQRDDQDDFQRYRIDVPEGQNTLVVRVSADEDVDLLLRRGAIPAFEAGPLRPYITDGESRLSVSGGGEEQITVDLPRGGAWYATVYSYDHAPETDYTLRVALNENLTGADDPTTDPALECGSVTGDCTVSLTGGGGGAAGPWELVVLAGAGGMLAWRRRLRGCGDAAEV